MPRPAYRAGSFYDADAKACRRAAEEIVKSAALPTDLPKTIYGGLVPHAGWVFSGRTAAVTLKALAAAGRLERAVIFGADHWGIAGEGAVYDQGAWSTPLGEVPIDEELAAALLKACPLLHPETRAHSREHSIEVQLPLMQVLSPKAKIVPIGVSPSARSHEVGAQVGQVLRRAFGGAGVIGSTDLTHYGPQYGFIPGGVGRAGIDWARDNDHRLLKLIETLRADRIVEETSSRANACGGGAIAATLAACRELGAVRGLCLEYATSADVMQSVYHTRADDAVGYAAVVFV